MIFENCFVYFFECFIILCILIIIFEILKKQISYFNNILYEISIIEDKINIFLLLCVKLSTLC